MQNGYLLPTRGGLGKVSRQLKPMGEDELDGFRIKLRIGMQQNRQVTLSDCTHLVTQMYCSALPVAYCSFPGSAWAPFAQLILDAAYEATFCAAVINAAQTGNRSLYLTPLSGVAFGNVTDWILAAIVRSKELFRSYELDVHSVSFRCSNSRVQQSLSQFLQSRR